MNIDIKSTARFLADAKAMIFGVAVFNLMWVWLRSPAWGLHRNIFVTALLFVSSVLLVLNKPWSNLMAAVLSGHLPIELVWAFWALADNAEVPVFSYSHFQYFVRNLDIEGGVLLFIGLASLILTRAVFAVVRSIPRGRPAPWPSPQFIGNGDHPLRLTEM